MSMMGLIRYSVLGIVQAIRWIFIAILRLYKGLISPLLPPNTCRFTPTCSEYMMQAIDIHGVVLGIWLGVKRIVRCNPWWGKHSCGYDPVPPATKKRFLQGND